MSWGNHRERIYLEDAGIDWSIIISWIFKKRDGDNGLD